MSTRTAYFTRRLRLGPYEIFMQAGRLVVDGPDQGICDVAVNRLYKILGSTEGCRLLGQALRGTAAMAEAAGQELSAKLGIPQPRSAESYESEIRHEGVAIDYDRDHDRIRAFNLPNLYTRTITEFEGIAAAVVYDHRLDDSEIVMIRDWMRAKKEFLNAWPLSELFDKMTRILQDGIISDAERAELFAFLDSIGASAEKCGQAAPSIFEDNVTVTFPQRTFLFTGKLLMCTRAVAEGAVVERGGTIAKSPNSMLSYLVVGDLGTDMWMHSRYGRKIEYVMEHKRGGGRTAIVREDIFRKALDNLAN